MAKLVAYKLTWTYWYGFCFGLNCSLFNNFSFDNIQSIAFFWINSFGREMCDLKQCFCVQFPHLCTIFSQHNLEQMQINLKQNNPYNTTIFYIKLKVISSLFFIAHYTLILCSFSFFCLNNNITDWKLEVFILIKANIIIRYMFHCQQYFRLTQCCLMFIWVSSKHGKTKRRTAEYSNAK